MGAYKIFHRGVDKLGVWETVPQRDTGLSPGVRVEGEIPAEADEMF